MPTKKMTRSANCDAATRYLELRVRELSQENATARTERNAAVERALAAEARVTELEAQADKAWRGSEHRVTDEQIANILQTAPKGSFGYLMTADLADACIKNKKLAKQFVDSMAIEGCTQKKLEAASQENATVSQENVVLKITIEKLIRDIAAHACPPR